MKLKHLLTSAVFAIASQQASATLYSYDVGASHGSNGAGVVTSISTSYDSTEEVFSWSHTIADKDGQSSNGFWLVVSDGENPKNNAGEYAIFYGDADNGVVTAYEYSGVNSGSSYRTPANYLGSYSLDYTHNDTTNEGEFSFSVDITDLLALNISPEWDVASFDTGLGYWFHPGLGSQFSYDQNGELTNFGIGRQGWRDTNDLVATKVPSPAPLGLLAIGLVGLMTLRNKRA